MRTSIVVGAHYGDCGKGLTTSWLTQSSDLPVTVVRFNGGAQAGHTVVVGDKRHVFHHFGSGTLDGARTHLSQFMVCNPILFNQEFDVLTRITKPGASIHPDAPITTPFEMLINQAIEQKRGNDRHGSCGMGIGETIEREEQGYRLHMSDLPSLDMKKLHEFRNTWVRMRMDKLGLQTSDSMIEFIYDDGVLARYLDDVDKMLFRTVANPNQFDHDTHLIFEGAQGLLLDEELGYFPHVTRSKTGIINPFTLLETMQELQGSIDVYYVSRCYQTRHGAGPMRSEADISPYYDVVDPTNVPNPWQGAIRYGLFDESEWSDAISRDINRVLNTYQSRGWILEVNNVITCLDQIRDPNAIPVRMTIDGKSEIVVVDRSYFENLANFVSYGPSAKTMLDVKNSSKFSIR